MSVFKRILYFPSTAKRLYFAIPDNKKNLTYLINYSKRRLRRKVGPLHQAKAKVMDRFIGIEKSNKRFLANQTTWKQISGRLAYLSKNHPDQVSSYVEIVIDSTNNPFVYFGLAMSKLSQVYAKTYIQRVFLNGGENAYQRVSQSQKFCCGLIVASSLLLDETEFQIILDKIKEANPVPSVTFNNDLDGFGYTPAVPLKNRHERTFTSSGLRSRKKHRLIIVDKITEDSALSLLTNGAEAVTIYQLSDLYGRANIEKQIDHGILEKAQIVHARTEISRFSPDYQTLHLQTQKLAESFVEKLNRQYKSLVADSSPHIALKMADTIFFTVLKHHALKKLVQSKEYDHIVFATEDKSSIRPFCKNINDSLGLLKDPRVEFLSISENPASRALFHHDLQQIFSRPEVINQADIDAKPLPTDEILEIISYKFRDIAKLSGEWRNRDGDAQPIMLVTAYTQAYSSAAYAYYEVLEKHFNLLFTFFGGRLHQFYKGFSNIPAKGEKNVDDLLISNNIMSSFTFLTKLIKSELYNELNNVEEDDLRDSLLLDLNNIATNGIVSVIIFYWYFKYLFENLKRKNELPKAVVLFPIRQFPVDIFSAVARNFGIPSIALEPFGLNASYCRYAKLPTDYYGTVSKYFCKEAARDFGISEERCCPIGSPRLLADKVVNLRQTTKEARSRIKKHLDINLKDSKVITFLSQPSKMQQIGEVWRIIIEATEGMNVELLLKTHPEESEFRITQYQKIAEEMGALQRVRHINIDINTAIEASDLLLSCYSATVLEVVLKHRTVFCVTNGDVDYPLEQHKVVGAPLLRSAAELRAEITAFQKNPEKYQKKIEKFLKSEPQMVDGFEPYLVKMINDICALPPEESVIPKSDVPPSLFLDGPFKSFPI